MNKELKYNGHTASPADYECPDGDLSVVMDLWPENGSLRPVLKPQDILQLTTEQRVMFLHETSSFTHYIVYDSAHNTLFWINKGSTVQTGMSSSGLAVGSLTHISGIGNTVIVFTTSGMRYYLWKGSNYAYLGTDIPEIQLSFGLQGRLERDDAFDISFESIAEGDIWKEFTEENKTRITNQVLGKVNKFIAEHSTNVGRFIYPFLVRYAYRLYDGTLTRHSAPVLMVCSSDLAPQVLYEHITGRRAYTDATLRIYAMVHQLDYACVSSSEISQLNDWKDIVNSVDVFVSAPIYTYDQNGECTKFSQTGASQSDSFSICKHVDQAVSQVTYPLRYQMNKFGKMYAFKYSTDFSYPIGRLMLPQKSAASVKEAIKNCSSFYLLEKIKVENLTTTRTLIDVEEDYLQSLVNREVMTDDYDSHDKLIPNYSFAYNSRLNLADLKKKLFTGFSSQAMFCFSNGYVLNWSDVPPTYMDEIYTVVCYVHIKQDGRDIVVQGGSGGIGYRTAPLFFYYPNINAYKVTVAMYMYGFLSYCYDVPLEAHSFLNGAFYFEGWEGPSVTGSIPSVTPEAQRIVNLPNKLYTSDVNNPFVFPVTNINTVGTGKIIAISTAAKALSQGQFGQFPLYAFTTDGVWALEVSGTTGGFSAKQPITRDVCLNKDSVTQIDSAVLFATDRGIILLAGSEAKCISDILDNGTDAAFDISTLPQASSILFNGLDHSFDFVPFRTFREGCRLLYDYVSYRLIVYNPSYAYAYIYSMNMKQWGMMRSNIVCGVNSYPECLAMTSDNRLIDLSQRVANTTPSNQVLITRPLKLDAPDILKTIDNIIQRGNFESGKVQVLLYGSRDLLNWFPVFSSTTHYLRGFRGTPYKYYRIVLKCSLADGESINGCSIEYDARQIGQPR